MDGFLEPCLQECFYLTIPPCCLFPFPSHPESRLDLFKCPHHAKLNFLRRDHNFTLTEIEMLNDNVDLFLIGDGFGACDADVI